MTWRNTRPDAMETAPGDLDTLQCPPCNGNCLQGRVCPARPQLTAAERARLERTWTIVDMAMAAAAVAFLAAVASFLALLMTFVVL